MGCGTAIGYDAASFVEFVSRNAIASTLERREIPEIPSSLFHFKGRAPLPTPAVPEIAIHLTIDGRFRYWADFGFGKFEGTKMPGHFGVTPPGMRTSFEGRGSYEVLSLIVPWPVVQRIADEAGYGSIADLGPLHSRMQTCPLVQALLKKLWCDTEPGMTPGPMFHGALVSSLLLRLLQMRTQPDQPAPPTVAKGGLAPWQIKRVLEYIEDDLSRNLTIEQLAGLCSLSTYHFARAFACSVGMPPHAYVTSRRIEAARKMLTETSKPVTEIALDVGYAEPSHFARVFRQANGVAPAAFRRQR